MAQIDTNIKKGQYLKKTGADSYVHYHFDTDDSIVYLSEKIDGTNGSGAAYAKDAKLHDTLCALYTLASKGGQAATDLATLTQKVNDLEAKHTSDISAVNTSITTTRNDLLGTTSDTASDNTIYGAKKAAKNAQDKANSAYDLASGLSKAYVFGNASAVYHGRVGGTVDSDGATDGTVIDKGFKVGDSVYVKDKLINDFWISAKRKLVNDDTELPISSPDDIKNATDGAEINVKWTIGREYYYVTLTAVETKANLDGYYDKNYINDNYLTKANIENDYVPYDGAKYNVRLVNHTITVSDGAQFNSTYTEISKGKIQLSGKTLPGSAFTEATVDITAGGISIGNKTFGYPDDTTSGTLATQEFVTDQGYQTADQVGALINGGAIKLKGDVTGSGKVNDNGIITTLSTTGVHAGTYSAITVDAKGRATAGYQQIRFASTINDPILNDLVVGGVAIIDA